MQWSVRNALARRHMLPATLIRYEQSFSCAANNVINVRLCQQSSAELCSSIAALALFALTRDGLRACQLLTPPNDAAANRPESAFPPPEALGTAFRQFCEPQRCLSGSSRPTVPA